MECKFYKVCPNGGIFTRCKTSGYAAECVPHIFDAMEDKIKERKIYITTNPSAALAKLARKFKIQAEERREPKRVKVRKHKRKKSKPECRTEIRPNRLSFIVNGSEIAFIDEAHPFGAYATNPVPTMERPK